mgnify:CR=1 FL=1
MAKPPASARKRSVQQANRRDEVTGTDFVGHEWDGIEELNTPLPRWWLWALYISIVWGVVYVILYPAWPMLNSATSGTLGWTSRGQLSAEMDAEAARRAPMVRALAAVDLNALPANRELMQFAIAGGAAAFRANCVQCHGSGATGSPGYANLRDDDWLWGGDMNAIHFTITNGIRNPDHPQTRMSLMPAFGRDGILTGQQIDDVVSHVRVISGQERASAASARGAVIFAENCAVCHGPTGEGMRSVGAPRLTDRIWLYGGDRATLTTSVANARRAVMPAWGGRLDPVTINMLTAYVHSLGGGEAAPAPSETGAQPAAPTVPATP